MNIITLVGNLADDAETTKNESIMFRVAVTVYNGKDANGEAKTLTNWYTIFTKNKGLKNYLKKGNKVAIVGIPSFSSYDNKPQVSVNAQNITLC